MTIWMDVDTALASVPVNAMPLIDDTDFKTIEAAVVYNQAGLALFWNFTTSAGVTTVTAVTPTTAGDYDWTDFTTSGMYGIEIPASGGASANNDTEGFGFFTGVATGILPWRGPEIGFRASAINDALVDSDTLLTSQDVGLLYESTIGTVSSQTVFLMDTAFSTSSWVGLTCTIEDVSTGQLNTRWVGSTSEASEQIALNAACDFTVVAGDIVRVHAVQHPTYALNTYDAATGTEAASILSKMLAYTQLVLRNDAAIATDNSAELTEINADGGSGAGTYVSTQDSQEGIFAHAATIKTQVDKMTFTVANEIDCNVKSKNDVTLIGAGTSLDKWRA